MRFVSICLVALVFQIFTLQNSALAANSVSFNYEGRVKIEGTPFDGTGQFKFAIVNTSGSVSMWSNDGTSSDGQEPTGFISLPVNDGVFNVTIGDTTLGMDEINGSIFYSQTPLKLRIWFNDGTHGFQQLNPDHNLVNIDLISLTSQHDDFTIYVRQSDGNDEDNGLTTQTAKKTIQAAVDILPERLRCNVTIDIEPGIYREEVIVSDVSVPQGKHLVLQGDTSWEPGSPTLPTVQVSGMDGGGTRVRESGIRLLSCFRVRLVGIDVEGTTNYGINTDFSECEIQQVHVSDVPQNGIIVGANSYVTMTDCVAEDCNTGVRSGPNSNIGMGNCTFQNNSYTGLLGAGQTITTVTSPCYFKDNLDSQIWLSTSQLDCQAPVYFTNSDTLNTIRGVSNAWNSIISSASSISSTGPGTISPLIYDAKGGSHWD
jgi:hypothetical protein